ncbi:MAG: hypothetical protein CME67_04520 [Halobacteriovoraceae bacterium]|nr:hypothetical protein [Peredibacter sp.]MBJ00473.1 hypothetical protein [Halobacteriovoraceae bacterium]|tara:strand:- start:1976 stop:2221 length:246 start_codon:yes stop_codon:yes gene_type:complete
MDKEELEALLELREIQTIQEGQNDNLLICECNCLSVKDLKEALLLGNLQTVDLDFLKEQLGLGSGCSSCIKNFGSWSKKIF